MSFIRNLFLQNFGTKVMALILAVVSWFYIYYAHTESAFINVPLIIETPAQIISSVEKDGEPIRDIKIGVEYPRGSSSDITGLVCRHKINIANDQMDKPQTIIVELAESDFNSKPGVRIKIPDNKIQVVLMKEFTKYMKIKTEEVIQGIPLKGYRVTSVKAIPSDILVRGPKNILDKYSEIPMGKIDVTNRNNFFSQIGRIESLENTKIITEDSFIVEVRIDEEMIEVVHSIKINILIPSDFPHYPIQIKPQEKVLKFRGPASDIKELKTRHINLFVDVGSLYTNTNFKPPLSFAPQLELRFTSDAPHNIELAEPLEQIKLEILPELQPSSSGTTPIVPPENK
ncbi:MAG: hypothetical protein V1871_02180 [Planctomycetota bacterium]